MWLTETWIKDYGSVFETDLQRQETEEDFYSAHTKQHELHSQAPHFVLED